MTYGKIIKSIFPNKKGMTPQTQPLPGQIENAAGGYYYEADAWTRLDRFLILGTEAGTYYVNAETLTKENAESVISLLKTDGVKVVARIVEISQSGRAPKNDSALFALALAAAAEDDATRKAALDALPLVARTGTHLLMFAEFVNSLRGWGRGLRKAVANWFVQMPAEKLCLQAVKYSQREGWTLRDLLRLAHPVTENAELATLIDWIAHPNKPEAIAAARSAFRLVEGKYQAKEVEGEKAVSDVIRKYSIPREAVPTDVLNSKEVWDALLVDMPMTAMIRNLGKMSAVELLAPFSDASDYVAKRLLDEKQLAKARIHPMQLLLALRTYEQGKGVLGKLKWDTCAGIIISLDKAFDYSFSQVVPTGKRILVGVDVSGSMTHAKCAGSPVLSVVEAAMAMAMFFVRTEQNVHTMAFDTEAHNFAITKNQRLDDVVRSWNKWGGGTDLSIPITYALKKKIVTDAFVILTDNETWAGKQHAVQALEEYRRKINPKAKLVVMATSANKGAVCDPNDKLSLGVAGFDASAPQLVCEFIKGEV